MTHFKFAFRKIQSSFRPGTDTNLHGIGHDGKLVLVRLDDASVLLLQLTDVELEVFDAMAWEKEIRTKDRKERKVLNVLPKALETERHTNKNNTSFSPTRGSS